MNLHWQSGDTENSFVDLQTLGDACSLPMHQLDLKTYYMCWDCIVLIVSCFCSWVITPPLRGFYTVNPILISCSRWLAAWTRVLKVIALLLISFLLYKFKCLCHWGVFILLSNKSGITFCESHVINFISASYRCTKKCKSRPIG